ncbi:rhodanese-like domain-containing protein [Lacipirellula limnantheis]|uniref:Putative metallo-hydrolase n=1 Tax=Lacipirellula limnantheis TaxID=2528024 RepID=A0A517U501_9BACT|nr:rhodanese-like domain-containing protein [Lacipirellula limnantheis]QDT75650.1 putative metallo-hydrolase [Lacipirellula limnantheis]
MLLKYFYDKSLAHASYLVGCQKSGEAIVIDPGRDVIPYLEAAKAEGLRIVGATETHIHADFVSGSRELADRVGAKLYLSDEGPADWKYAFANQYGALLLHDGDEFYVGKVKLEVLHTPGHTPESISFVLTDVGGGANVPMGIFTGDFVFVGSIGRPDLLETAAGVVGSAEVGARQLYHSMLRFRELPDHLQVWPAHGAGSACGKGLGAIPSSTVGYEKLFNPALQFDDEQEFVDYILTDQPETPFYFAVMKRVNKVGPELTKDLAPVRAIDPTELATTAGKHLVIDTTAAGEFAKSHVPGTVNVPASNLVQWAGFFVDYAKPIYLIADEASLPAQLRSLRSIGIDNVGGFLDAGSVKTAGLRTESYRSATPAELRRSIDDGEVTLVDVRAATEFDAGHIAGAEHRFLGTLLRNLSSLGRDKPVATQCLAGGRSAIAASILQRGGFEVVNMQGGYRAWVDAGLPVVREDVTAVA